MPDHPEPITGSRKIKSHLLQILQNQDWEQQLQTLDQIPAKKLISPLFGLLCSGWDQVHWRAVSLFGLIVPRLINEQGLEPARVVMRRLIWTLNDESGGIGWGSPEAMGEIMANSSPLAEEYHKILTSFIQPSLKASNYLEYEPLRQGAYWGLARLASRRQDLLLPFKQNIIESLMAEKNQYILAYGSLLLSCLQPERSEALALLHNMGSRPLEVRIYWERELKSYTVQNLAHETLGLSTAPSGV